MALAGQLTKESFTYDEVYGQFVTVHQYIDAPPQAVYEYLTDVRNLNEYTYSTRDFAPTDVPGVYQGRDVLLDDQTKIFMRIDGDPNALTVDMRCAWDQGQELWMNYLHRIVPAEIVLNKPGSGRLRCRKITCDNRAGAARPLTRTDPLRLRGKPRGTPEPDRAAADTEARPSAATAMDPPRPCMGCGILHVGAAGVKGWTPRRSRSCSVLRRCARSWRRW